MSAEKSIPLERRIALFVNHRNELEDIAFTAHRQGAPLDQMVVICAEVDDPVWHKVVTERLVPGHEADWQGVRDLGERPLAFLACGASAVDLIKPMVPSLSAHLDRKPPANKARVLILAAGGINIHSISPKHHGQN